MKLPVYDLSNQRVGEVEVSDENFAVEVRPHLHHEAVRHYLARQRSGTHATLNRRIVSGSTRKLYKQKGVGRARHGSVKANNFVGGGIVFGPMPRDYSYKPPRKVRRAALRCALAKRLADQKLWVIDSLELPEIKTKAIAAVATRFGWNSALFVDENNEHLQKSARNLVKHQFLLRGGLNVYDILRYEHLVVSKAAVQNIMGALSK